MNFFDIKRRFRELSGRHDLADDDSTNTLDFIINEACKNLDRLTEHQKSPGIHFVQCAVDAYSVSIPYCRSIKEVWVTSTTERWQLEKKNLQDLVYSYLTSQPDSGSPLYYAPTITRRIPEGVDVSAFSAYMTFMDTSTDLDHNHNAILLLPPTSEILLVEVKGLFYSAALVEDADENYWTVVHPLTLLKATMRELEVFNQNKSKVDAWDQALASEIANIGKDLVEEEIAEVDQMEGSVEKDVS
jgi:hypothetical protein